MKWTDCDPGSFVQSANTYMPIYGDEINCVFCIKPYSEAQNDFYQIPKSKSFHQTETLQVDI